MNGDLESTRHMELIGKIYVKHIHKNGEGHIRLLRRVHGMFRRNNFKDDTYYEQAAQDIFQTACESFLKYLMKCTIAELEQALEDGMNPCEPQYTLMSFYKNRLLGLRFDDFLKKNMKQTGKDVPLNTEEGDPDHDVVDSRKDQYEIAPRDVTFATSSAKERSMRLLTFLDGVIDPEEKANFSGQKRSPNAVYEAILRVEIDGGHDVEGTKEQRVAELLELKFASPAEWKSFRNACQDRLRKLREMARDFRAWCTYDPVYRGFADRLRPDSPLIVWFKYIECKKLPQRQAQPKLRRVLSWSDGEAQQYAALGERYGDSKEQYLVKLAAALARGREELGKEALDDPFAYKYAVEYFSQGYGWPRFLED